MRSGVERWNECGSRFHVDWPGLLAPFDRERARNKSARCGGPASDARRTAQAARRHFALFRRRERRSNKHDQDRVEVARTGTWPGARLGHASYRGLKPLRKQHANEPGLVSISKMFVRERLKSYRRAQEAVQSAQFRTLVLDTAEWVEAGPWSTSEDSLMRARREMPIEIRAAEQLSRRRKKIMRRGAKIGDLSPEQLHRLRIQVKKTRYAAEFFSSVYSGNKSKKRSKKVLSSLTQLQNCLGGINDIVTRKALFAEIIANPKRGLTAEQNRQRAFAAGLIIGDQQAQIRHLLDGARKAYSRFDSAKAFWKLPRRRSGVSPPQPPSPGNQ